MQNDRQAQPPREKTLEEKEGSKPCEADFLSSSSSSYHWAWGVRWAKDTSRRGVPISCFPAFFFLSLHFLDLCILKGFGSGI